LLKEICGCWQEIQIKPPDQPLERVRFTQQADYDMPETQLYTG
jgi:hypothetical protein